VPIGYSDSDFAGDKIISKLIFGYLFIIANGLISWKSKRGSIIALSTLEVEIDAFKEAICEAEWLIGFYSEI